MNINKLFDYEDFNDADFIKTQKEIGETGGTHRKSWEFTIMTYGLNRYFTPNSVSLGLGCLKENIMYYYANKCSHTYATDIAYYPKGDPRLRLWGSEGYTVSEVYETDVPYDKSKLTVLPMDMMNIEFPDETFDIIWSSSSVEHIGGLPEILTCFEEVRRTLKPNGIFSITTEWNLDYPSSRAVRFSNVQSFDYYVLEMIEKMVPELVLVEPLTLDRSDHYKNFEREYMLGRTNRFYGNAIDYTSVSLFWRKE